MNLVTGAKVCVTCCKENCSYKCPKCLSPYCSLGCWGSHKLLCPAIVSKPGADDAVPVPANQDVLSMIAKSVESTRDDQIEILQPSEKEGIRKSTKLQSLLKSKRLRDDILCVDSSSDRAAALKAMRTKNPEFNQFVEDLLRTVKS